MRKVAGVFGGLVWAAVLVFGLSGVAHAQSAVTEPQEWGKRIKAAESIGALGTDLFGDSTNYYDGGTTFSVTDIDLPGNNSLPVRVGRTLEASDLQGTQSGDLMANWNLDI